MIDYKKIWNHPITQYVASKWFFICLAIFIVIARFAPTFACDGGLIKGQYSIGYGAVAWIFLGSGLSMKTKRILANMGNWRAHLTILIMSFLITSSIIYGFCVAIKVSNDKNIDDWVLIGLILTAACPTTVASNVIMTTNAGGNDLLCVCEVVLGNLLGAFITPAIVQMYTRQYPFQYGNPAKGNSMNALYARVMKQVGLSVFVPLFVGQMAQNFLPKLTKIYLDFCKKYHLKIGSYMLLLIMFSSFSTAFNQKSFTSVSHLTIIFICFFNFGIYLLFTIIAFILARPWFVIKIWNHQPTENDTRIYKWTHYIFRPFYYNKRDTICIMFCGPAKTAALGVSLITSQYGNDKENLGKLLVPLVLYQSIQVLTASFFVPVLKKWARDEIEKDKLVDLDVENNKDQEKKIHDLSTENCDNNEETTSNTTTNDSSGEKGFFSTFNNNSNDLEKNKPDVLQTSVTSTNFSRK